MPIRTRIPICHTLMPDNDIDTDIDNTDNTVSA